MIHKLKEIELKKQLLKIGRFFRVVDESEPVLSITNTAVLVVLAKVTFSAEPSIAEMGGLLITLALYYGKKRINKDKSKLSDENKKAIEDVTAKVQQIADKTSGLAASIGLRNPLQK